MVVAGGDGGDGVMVRGAPPRRPGRGGGRRWRRRVREMEMPGEGVPD